MHTELFPDSDELVSQLSRTKLRAWWVPSSQSHPGRHVPIEPPCSSISQAAWSDLEASRGKEDTCHVCQCLGSQGPPPSPLPCTAALHASQRTLQRREKGPSLGLRSVKTRADRRYAWLPHRGASKARRLQVWKPVSQPGSSSSSRSLGYCGGSPAYVVSSWLAAWESRGGMGRALPCQVLIDVPSGRCEVGLSSGRRVERRDNTTVDHMSVGDRVGWDGMRWKRREQKTERQSQESDSSPTE